MIIQRQITWKWYNIQLYLQWPTNRKSYMIYQSHSFMVTPFFYAEYLRNGTTYRHNVIEILIGTYTRVTQQCHFERPWLILSDLAKYSVTGSITWSLCDSWASCLPLLFVPCGGLSWLHVSFLLHVKYTILMAVGLVVMRWPRST